SHSQPPPPRHPAPSPPRRSSDLGSSPSPTRHGRLKSSLVSSTGSPNAGSKSYWRRKPPGSCPRFARPPRTRRSSPAVSFSSMTRSEEHTSELQSPDHLVCRILLE